MNGILREFLIYSWLLVVKLFSKATLVIGAIALIIYLTDFKHDMPRKYYWVVVIIAFYLSAFQVYKEKSTDISSSEIDPLRSIIDDFEQTLGRNKFEWGTLKGSLRIKEDIDSAKHVLKDLSSYLYHFQQQIKDQVSESHIKFIDEKIDQLTALQKIKLSYVGIPISEIFIEPVDKIYEELKNMVTSIRSEL
jgi:uncharacterized membrane protein YiaA